MCGRNEREFVCEEVQSGRYLCTYAIKHPEHYLNYTPINNKHTSHIEPTLSLAFEYGITLSGYELPVKNMIAHPTDRIPIKNIDLELSDSYLLFSEYEFIFLH